MARQVTAQPDETIDALCWRALGRSEPVEAVYAANPGLAALGPRLPAGTSVIIPDTATAATPAAVRDIVQLWS